MKQYIDLVNRIVKEGGASDDRTGTGTIKIFGHQSVYDMDEGFPLLTLKNTWMKGVTHELLWLLGNHQNLDAYKNLEMTNIKYLVDNNVHIWDEWANKSGDLGPVYGQQWVAWRKAKAVGTGSGDLLNPSKNSRIIYEGINQIQIVINKLTEGHCDFNPMDRGLVVSAWNVGELDEMALRPCHAFFQFQARELSFEEREEMFWSKVEVSTMEVKTHESFDGIVPRYELSLQLYQRSADTFLGVPFNIASYSLLLHMVCHVTVMKPGKFVHTFGDAHLYSNHKDQVNTLLSRTNNYELYAADNPDTSNFKDIEPVDYFSAGNRSPVQMYMGPKLPELWLNPEIKNIFDFQYEDIKVLDYNPLPAIKAEVAV